MNKLIAVMSSFNPDHHVLENIRHNLHFLDHLVVVDDGSINNQLLENFNEPKTKIIKLESNQGIAKALNIGLYQAVLNDADYVLFLDQDTRIESQFKEKVLEVFDLFANSNNVGIVVPGNVNGISSRPRRYLAENVGVVSDAIQSGMTVSRSCLGSIGNLDERLFIDAVDTEFCLRAHRKKWVIAAAMDVNIQHKLGQKVVLNFFGLSIKKRGDYVEFDSHSPFRRYYMTRNNVDLIFRYLFSRPVWAVRQIKAEFGMASLAIISGPKRFKLFLAIMCGLFHGVFRVRGKIPNSLFTIID